MDRFSKLHVSIEFNQLHKFGLINESQRYIDNIEYIAQEISDIIVDYIKCRDSKLYSVINFSDLVIYKSDISVDAFFDEIHFANSFCFINSDTPGVGSYHSDKSGMTNKKYIVTLGIQYSSSVGFMEETLPPLIAHELAHAYEDYKINKDTSITDKFQNKQPINLKSKIYKLLLMSEPYTSYMGGILYFSLKDEITAMKNEICDEIFLNKVRITDNLAAHQILKNTEVYKRIKSVEREIDFLKKGSVQKKTELTDIYNDIFGTDLSDFDKVLKRMETGFTNAKHSIIKTASKYISSMYMLKDTGGYIRRGKKYK